MKMMRLRLHAVAVLALCGLGLASPAQTHSADPARLPDKVDTEALAEEAAAAPEAEIVSEAPAEADPVEETFEMIGEGEASYYGHELAGNRTASGEIFRPEELTAAHRTLPLGTKLRVTNTRNGKSVIVRVNDRGPFVGSRLIDLSLGAARKIQMVSAGKANVRLERLH